MDKRFKYGNQTIAALLTAFFITIAVSLTALFIIAFTSGCSRSGYRQMEGMAWHTTYHVTYDSGRDLNDSIVAVINEVGASLNVFDPESVASRANEADSVPVDSNYIKVYEMSVLINRRTDGAFDPTLGPLIDAWGFGKGHEATADTLRLDSLLNLTGIAKTRLENGMLIKGNAGMRFNFSAIAKGYGVDCVAMMLERNGVSDYLVEIGGEIRCKGKNPKGEDWKISIDKPEYTADEINESQCVVAMSGGGLATSGNYRNFHAEGNRKYGHTISSKTGRPVQTDVISATVIAPTCMEADALATSMMAMGSIKSKELALKLDYPVMLVLADRRVWESPRFARITCAEAAEP